MVVNHNHWQHNRTGARMSKECVLRGMALSLTISDLGNGVVSIGGVSRVAVPVVACPEGWEPLASPMPDRVRDAVGCSLASLHARSICGTCVPAGRCRCLVGDDTEYLVWN